MTTEKLLDAIGLIQDQTIQEAKDPSVPISGKDRLKKRIAQPLIKRAAVAASFLLVLGFGIWGGYRLSIGQQSPTDGSGRVLAPHFMANDQMFWRSPYEEFPFETLPDGYVECGAIQNIVPIARDLDQYQNFDSVYGHVGDKIFINPEKPDTAYLYTEMGHGDGKYYYLLFLTQALREQTVFYDGKLYYDVHDFTKKPWEEMDRYEIAGTIQRVELDVIPNTALQSNIPDSLGHTVYVDKTAKDRIYLELMGTDGKYSVELRVRE